MLLLLAMTVNGWSRLIHVYSILNTKFNLMFFDSYFRGSGEVYECLEVFKVCHHILDLLSVAKGRCNCAKFQINAADA